MLFRAAFSEHGSGTTKVTSRIREVGDKKSHIKLISLAPFHFPLQRMLHAVAFGTKGRRRKGFLQTFRLTYYRGDLGRDWRPQPLRGQLFESTEFSY
jgi:hypothetical protein